MNRAGKVYYKNLFVGILKEDEAGFSFMYDESYLSHLQARASRMRWS